MEGINTPPTKKDKLEDLDPRKISKERKGYPKITSIPELANAIVDIAVRSEAPITSLEVRSAIKGLTDEQLKALLTIIEKREKDFLYPNDGNNYTEVRQGLGTVISTIRIIQDERNPPSYDY